MSDLFSTLSNESINPSKLRRYFISKHLQLKDKPKEYFENMRASRQNQSKRFKNVLSIPKKAQIASYKIVQLLVKKKKTHLDAKNLILPALEIAVETMMRLI